MDEIVGRMEYMLGTLELIKKDLESGRKDPCPNCLGVGRFERERGSPICPGCLGTGILHNVKWKTPRLGEAWPAIQEMISPPQTEGFLKKLFGYLASLVRTHT